MNHAPFPKVSAAPPFCPAPRRARSAARRSLRGFAGFFVLLSGILALSAPADAQTRPSRAAPSAPAVPLVAVDSAELPPPPLRVGVIVSPPFVVDGPDGTWRGLAVELWRETAKAAGRAYEIAAYPSRDALTAAVAEGRIDVAVGDLRVGAAGERRLDFLTPYRHARLGIATQARARGGLSGVLHALASRVALEVAALMLAAVAVLALIAGWRQGNGSGMRRRAVRLAGLGLLPVGVALVAGHIAPVSPAPTVDRAALAVPDAAGLARVESGVVKGQAGLVYAQAHGLAHRSFVRLDDAFAGLRAGAVGAVIADRAELEYALRRAGGDGLTVLSDTLRADRLAFAVGEGSALREPLNRALLEIIESGAWGEIPGQYGVGR